MLGSRIFFGGVGGSSRTPRKQSVQRFFSYHLILQFIEGVQ